MGQRARRVLLGVLASGAMAMAAVSSAGVAARVRVHQRRRRDRGLRQHADQLGGGARQQPVRVGPGPLDGATAIGDTSAATAGDPSGPGPGNVAAAGVVSNPVRVAESMVGTYVFGPYGCEDFVDAVYGRTTATGMGHNLALDFYQSLAARGLGHHDMPVHAAHWCSPQVPMATMSTSLAVTARMFPVACKDFRPVMGTVTTCRFCLARTLARGRCTGGFTRPGRTDLSACALRDLPTFQALDGRGDRAPQECRQKDAPGRRSDRAQTPSVRPRGQSMCRAGPRPMRRTCR